MIPAYFLLVAFLAQGFLTWLILDLFRSEHRETVRALIARNAPEMKMLETPPPARKDPRTRRPLEYTEAELADMPPRVMGL